MDLTDIKETLEERGKNYGEFKDHASVSQRIKKAMKHSNNWEKLDDDQKEALEMVAHKVARILNGKKDLLDSWHDCIGYLKLVEDRLK